MSINKFNSEGYYDPTAFEAMVADDKIFDQIPLKKEVKATVSGIYITDVRGMRGPLPAPPEKVGFFKKIKNKVTGKK